MKFFKELSQIFYRLMLVELCLLLLIFPLEAFRISAASTILPSFEIILLYYFATIYHISFGVMFLIGIVFDQLYSMPIGTNSLVLISAHLLVKLLGKYFILRGYLTNFIIFCCYYFYIIHCRYLLIVIKDLTSQGYLVLVMQYLTTIFSYNLIRIPFDKRLK
ncbi:hypothetical protein [Candidatus Tisiphia endosymbiont of Nemotelus uliginosus]|uniref:hypothetical protein n=1 Tax=Candidatus Tisiphia endosymbiont of Nemotelus uliginosus TaxID=3077926 RepID=UPI0035C8C669